MKTLNKWAAMLTLAVVGMAGCGEVSEVQLGALLSLEGRASSYGQSIQRGIEVAVDRVNAAGGVDVGGNGTRVPFCYEY